MSDPPWKPDHVTTLHQARDAIGAQFPQVETDGIEHLGAGWEFDAFATADGWVFRFPRRDEAPAQFAVEPDYLALVRGVLAPEVAVPRIELLGEPTGDIPYPFAGHRLIAGVGADHRGVPDHPDLPRQLGTALSRIHGIPVEPAHRIGVRVEPEVCRDWRDEALALLPQLEGLDSEVDRAIAWLRSDPLVPAPYAGPPRLLHNDLCPDHVILDRDTGALVGLIDWTDMSIGDPALDFTFLVTWRGPAFARAVADHYALPIDPGFWDRLFYQARAFSLIWLAETVAREADVAKHVRWVTNAITTDP